MEPVILFVLENSPYKQAGFDCYDKQRNALTYTGNNPVVAHPPCQLWGKMAKINYIRWGGEHNRPGNDGGCFRFALDTVNRCGGVLEHPAGSYAWAEYGLIKPLPRQWTKSGDGWTCEVWQSAYGHKANKKTWLYYKGKAKPKDPIWDRPKGTHQIGFYDQRGKERNKPTLSKYEANATPKAFMEYLIELAREAQQPLQPDNGYVCNRPGQCAKGQGGMCFSGFDCPDKAIAGQLNVIPTKKTRGES